MAKINDNMKKIVENLIANMKEKGTDWVQSWSAGGAPMNFKSKKYYRGLNNFILSFDIYEKGFTSSKYVTFKQAKEMGYRVKKGSKGVSIFFFKEVEKKDKDEKYFLLKTYTVFNVEQLDGYEIEVDSFHHDISERDRKIEDFLSNLDIKISIEGRQPRYNFKEDIIKMTDKKYFKNIDDYYSTLFHELTHATGHESRLNRNIKNCKNSQEYAFEELVAELGSIFLSANFKINYKKCQHEEYLNSWISILENDPRVLWKAASQAQNAFDYLTNNFDKDRKEKIAS